MELRHLDAVLAVAEEGSFTAAADLLATVQSNVSEQVRQLEAELGAELFVRSRRGARPTDSGEVVLTPESRATLDAIATTLNAYPNATVRIDGHTDNVGDRASNVDLSLARANAVARLLSERGVDPARVTTAGFGPDRPAPNP